MLSFTSPDFGVDDGGGFGMFLGFFVCHGSVVGWIEVVVLVSGQCIWRHVRAYILQC